MYRGISNSFEELMINSWYIDVSIISPLQGIDFRSNRHFRYALLFGSCRDQVVLRYSWRDPHTNDLAVRVVLQQVQPKFSPRTYFLSSNSHSDHAKSLQSWSCDYCSDAIFFAPWLCELETWWEPYMGLYWQASSWLLVVELLNANFCEQHFKCFLGLEYAQCLLVRIGALLRILLSSLI